MQISLLRKLRKFVYLIPGISRISFMFARFSVQGERKYHLAYNIMLRFHAVQANKNGLTHGNN